MSGRGGDDGMMEYTRRLNINRGYMKLEVWKEAVELLGLVNKILADIEKLDVRLKSQLIDSAQSISSNIAEGYRKQIGGLGESASRKKKIGRLGAGNPRTRRRYAP